MDDPGEQEDARNIAGGDQHDQENEDLPDVPGERYRIPTGG